MGDWATLALLCMTAAVLQLDAASFGQFMVSRPLVLGALLGALGGDGNTGFALGLAVELLLMAELPIGGALPLNGPVSAAAAVLAALPPLAIDLPWALALGLLAGWVWRPFEARLRQFRAALAARVEERVEADRPPAHARTIAAALAAEAGAVFVFLALAVPAGKALGGWWWDWGALREGAGLAWKAAPIVALVGAMQLLGPRAWQR